MTDKHPSMLEAEHGDGMSLRFWGVRGSLPTPGPGTVRYGGNTVCVELRCGPHLLILDASSGLRELGGALTSAGNPVDADILLSHAHLDHICGLPFFKAMYDPGSRVRFWGGDLEPAVGIAQAPLMQNVDADFRANIAVHSFVTGESLELHPGLRVETTLLRHPGQATGYRVTWDGSSVCYITDTEHPADGLDKNLLRFVADADVLVYDASYTDAEYQSQMGLGHSTWQAGANLADAAAVGRLVLFHHDPSHGDATMDEIAAAVADRRPGSMVAMEGMRFAVGGMQGLGTPSAAV